MAVTISLLDKKNSVETQPERGDNRRSLVRGAVTMFTLSSICFILGVIFSAPLKGLAFEAIFMMAVMLAFVGVILYTNAVSTHKDAKAYDYEPALFRMNGGLVAGAMGIVIILVALYAYFW